MDVTDVDVNDDGRKTTTRACQRQGVVRTEGSGGGRGGGDDDNDDDEEEEEETGGASKTEEPPPAILRRPRPALRRGLLPPARSVDVDSTGRRR